MNSGTMAFCAPAAGAAISSTSGSLLLGAWHSRSLVRHDCCNYPSVWLADHHPRRQTRTYFLTTWLSASNAEEENDSNDNISEQEFLQKELSRIDSLEQLLEELEQDSDDQVQLDLNGGEQPGTELEELDADLLDEETWLDLFGSLPEEADPVELAEMERIPDHEELLVVQQEEKQDKVVMSSTTTTTSRSSNSEAKQPIDPLENALLQGVVPADAGVGSESLPGDFGFDPLDLASKDYIGDIQTFVANLVPGGDKDKVADASKKKKEPRPSALILRDYREAEIRHGRLAMLAAVLWPLQEMLDRLLLDEDQFGSTTIVYGGVTLPYLPLFMTAIMLLLGYLDIYSTAIKDMDKVGEAFLPGDCFWDPLAILEGAPPSMKRNMQERELFNGRAAMLAVALYIYEEAIWHQPLITIPGNELLFEPAYQIPYIQKWLDSIFASTPSTINTFPEVGTVDFTKAMKDVIQEEEVMEQIAKQGGDALSSGIPK